MPKSLYKAQFFLQLESLDVSVSCESQGTTDSHYYFRATKGAWSSRVEYATEPQFCFNEVSMQMLKRSNLTPDMAL
jgi:hypothetical protein